MENIVPVVVLERVFQQAEGEISTNTRTHRMAERSSLTDSSSPGGRRALHCVQSAKRSTDIQTSISYIVMTQNSNFRKHARQLGGCHGAAHV